MKPTLKSLQDIYVEGNYDAVLESLRDMREDLPGGLFHFNLGTVYTKKDELAVGRYHLEKAIQEGYYTPSALNNLKVVRQKLALSDIDDSHHFSDKALSYGVSLSFDFYMLGTLLILLAIGILRTWRGMFKKWKELAIVILVAMTPVMVGFYFHQFKFAVSLKESQVYEGPSQVFEKKVYLPGGAKVIIDRFHNGWYFIERPQAYSGWVKKEDIGIL